MAIPDRNFGSIQHREVQIEARHHLARVVHTLLGQYMPGTVMALTAQGPNFPRDLVLFKELWRLGLANAKDNMAPCHYAFLGTAGLGIQHADGPLSAPGDDAEA